MSPHLDTKKGGGTKLPSGEGVEGPNSDNWIESLALCILCWGLGPTSAHFLTVLNLDDGLNLVWPGLQHSIWMGN